MSESAAVSLRDLALKIWKASVRAVDADRLVRQQITVRDGTLTIAGHAVPTGNLVVVGAGKAGAAMSAGVEGALAGSEWASRLSGWVNVPADCVRKLPHIHLHAARPAGVNEPTAAGVAGTREILNRVSALHPEDTCLVLLSGGGSALLPAPVEGVSLEDKLEVTRFLSRSGATIQELNAVRSAISRIKGGGLARACTAGQMIVLIISDVIGDPLDVIASGPTVNVSATSPLAAEVLKKFDPDGDRIPASIHARIKASREDLQTEPQCPVHNHIIGNNAVAVQAAAAEAARLGIDDVRILAIDQPGVASVIGRELAQDCRRLRDSFAAPLATDRITCLLSGGEPVVRLNSSHPTGKGGRNQELVLAATNELWSILDGISVATPKQVCELLAPHGFNITRERMWLVEEILANGQPFDVDGLYESLSEYDEGSKVSRGSIERALPILVSAGLLRIRMLEDGREVYELTGADGIAILSGGTDGEDGPTDAAGAMIDEAILKRARALDLNPAESLARNDSYTFFDKCDGLIQTGPTHTNVMDIRVALIRHRKAIPKPAEASS